MGRIIKQIIAKDLKLFWGLLMIWGFVLLMKELMIVRGDIFLNLVGISRQLIGLAVTTIMAALDYVLVFILVPLIVHEEPCVGTTAFWFSKPISRSDLLLTKSTFLTGLFVLLPALLTAAAVTTIGFAGNLVIWSFLNEVFMRLSFILAIVLIAACTRKFSGYATWNVVYFIISFVPGFLVSFFFHFREISFTLGLSIQIVSEILRVLLLLGLITYQYLSHQTFRTSVIFSIGTFLVLTMSVFWPIDFMSSPSKKADIELLKDKIEMTFDKDHFFVTDGWFKNTATKVIRSHSEFQTLPPGTFLEGVSSSSMQMWFEDGDRLTSLSGSLKPSSGWAGPFQSSLSGVDIKQPWQNDFKYETIFELSKDDFEKYKDQPGTYAVDVRFNAYQYDKIAEVSFQKGSIFTQGRSQFEVRELTHSVAELKVLLVSRELNFLFGDTHGSDKSYARGGEVYVLRNKRTRQGIIAYGKRDYDTGNTSSMTLFPYARNLNFGFQETGIAITPDWLNDSDLIVFKPKYVGIIEKKIRIKDFALPSITTDPDPARHDTPNDASNYNEFEVSTDYYADSPLPAGITNPETIRVYRQEYLTRRNHKAFAITGTQNYGYSYHHDSLEAAREDALERCNHIKAATARCVIVDINGKIQGGTQ